MVLISVLNTKLKRNSDKVSPCNTRFSMVIGSVKYLPVAMDIQ